MTKKMESHLDTASIITGLSNKIQNDLIEAIHKVMLNEMQKEIDQAKFVDETSDVSASSQLSTVLRYVTEDCVTKERFIGFSDVSADRSANALSEHVFKCIELWKCENKLIAQTYNGATTMAGQLNGLQAKSKSHDIVYCKEQIDKTRTVLENKLDNFSIFYDRRKDFSYFLFSKIRRKADHGWIRDLQCVRGNRKCLFLRYVDDNGKIETHRKLKSFESKWDNVT
ncbi:Hypothetical predicted protein [Octopus vulgaris]|uniref:DUF4371 domain-containing protein n=1 Tax=Octopus vulgaris TaxID=6645 RepID=A0AA36BN86_OCTVU|nr:Hypothetical predicted protein [Octopus vulgaris]